jgi:hypothetical protein
MALLAPNAARAEGLFDFLFGGSDPEPQQQQQRVAPGAGPRGGGLRRSVNREDGDASHRRRVLTRGESRGGGESGEMSGGSFCVRTCDGYFFPLIRSSRATRQQSCEYLCPSTPVELYQGSSIEQARNARGERYSALPTAFRFRDKATEKCACIDPTSSSAYFQNLSRNDPTLRSGDVVIEDSGPFVYNGSTLVTLGRASVPSQVRDRLRAMLRRNPTVGPPVVAADARDEEAAKPAPAQKLPSAPAQAKGSIEFGTDAPARPTTKR